MKSSPSRIALSVEIKPSRAIYVALVGIAGGAIAAIFYADISLFARGAAAIFAIAYTGWSWRLQIRQRGHLHWRDRWMWQPAAGSEQVLQLHSSTLWPGLIVLVFRDTASRRALTFALWRDSLDADDARRLRVCLRHSPVFELERESVLDT